jgi:cytolysin-activating lysine-acyltransferase
VWLLSQSSLHRELPIKALEWSFMPAILSEQFRIFRFGPLPGLQQADPKVLEAAGLMKSSLEQLPLGVAIWAKLSEDAEAKLERGEKLAAEDWRSGDRVWLVEMITPFATPENKLALRRRLDPGRNQQCPRRTGVQQLHIKRFSHLRSISTEMDSV